MRLKFAALVPVLALAASGCSAFSEDSGTGTDGGGGVKVVAAFYPLAWVAEQVGGEHVSVEALAPPGSEPHDLEINVQQTGLIADADLVVFEHDFMPAVDATVEENATGELLDAAEAVELMPFEDEHAEEEHAEESGEHAEEEHAEEEDEHVHGDEHDHGDLDPHFWHDPVRVATLGVAVANRLAELDPDHADEYNANAEALRAELTDLDEAFATGLAQCERDTIVVSHDAFGYLEKYGLHMAPIAGLSPDAEPTPADIGALQELIEDEGITTVFSETLVSPEVADTLASDLGIASEVLDPIEGLTSETSDDDYLSLMEANLAAIRKANDCQ